ncbi:MAG: hypothetical protein ACFWTK_06950 [Clostridium sp.]
MPHGTSAYMAPIACLVDVVIDKIPGVKNVDITADSLQEKVGVLGEPIVIGGILGAVIGFLAGYSPKEALPSRGKYVSCNGFDAKSCKMHYGRFNAIIRTRKGNSN